ncbi:glycosyltransferase family 2 protein [Verrucosispora sp. WMMD573]|uniref:glycosyltransferase family 2 protein n=1 Tax=Verrucosispora sp. WMMD573 TaxID=3015149 RepID=UPI00248ADC06|nr:glycosyltransferase family 2 protein [Verrucosispora sp. WMMD573]WBB53683.1 glycosyltransferase family 2 protein [Verrucosispora sp. WMMD573]
MSAKPRGGALGPPCLSILLTSWNTREQTRQCLETLAATAPPDLDYEVVAVDNASRDGSAELLARWPRVHLIRNSRNVGFAPAVNQAYRRARGELILLLNSDVAFHPGALSTMLSFLKEHPAAAGVSPLYRNPDGTFQQHYVQQPRFLASLALVTALRRVPGFRQALHTFEMRGQDFSRPRLLASGSCMLLRRAVLAPDHIFDERFPVYWNDAILARQLERAGQQLWMIPDAVVTHVRGASCRLLGPSIRFRHLLGSLVTYLRMTQPRHRVALFRLVVLADHAAKRICGRTAQLTLADLRAALRGDVGPLPDGDIRDWLIVFTRTPSTPELDRAVIAETLLDDPEQRLLLVDPPTPRPRWRSRVTRIDDRAWHLTPPAPLPFGARLRTVDTANRRFAAAAVRRWLDRQAGARLLRLDDAGARTVLGRIGEDEVLATTRPVPVRQRVGHD